MSIKDKLATSLGRRDEVPNQELAREISVANDTDAIKELINFLSDKSKDIQNDSIKVLYEIGEKNPALISAYIPDFIPLLTHRNNRLQWGAMAALNTIASINPGAIYATLDKIIAAADNSSVITRDQAVSILTKLCAIEDYTDTAFVLLNEQLIKSPVNQLPMYAENASPVIPQNHKSTFINTLNSRLDEIEKDTKRNRVEKVIKKMSK